MNQLERLRELVSKSYDKEDRHILYFADPDLRYVNDLLNSIPKLMAVVDAAKTLTMHGHPQMTGNCSTDHYIGKECDCGFSDLEDAVAALESNHAAGVVSDTAGGGHR